MNDYNNQIGKNMKLRELLNIESVIAKHTDKLRKLTEKDVNDLSISELAFIKMVSSGSITAMKKNGATNARILTTEKNEGLSQEEKVKRYLKAMAPEDLKALFNEMK